MFLYTLIPLGLAAGCAVALALGLHLNALLSWGVSSTLVTFVTFGYDKIIAGTDRTRVPENVLLLTAFTGGTLGALAGMLVFHHKTSKRRFQARFWLVVVVQLALLATYAVWGRAWIAHTFG
jgi:uncharacterized membrane protein YsdA (DUF1294 family)